MVFLDSNVPMYIIGAPHDNRTRALAMLDRLITAGTKLVTDAEVFQEILHRYAAINRTEAIQPAFDTMSQICDQVYAVEYADVESAKSILYAYPRLSPRDAIHIAIMRRADVTDILSFDAGFDEVPGIYRITAQG